MKRIRRIHAEGYYPGYLPTSHFKIFVREPRARWMEYVSAPALHRRLRGWFP